jgi:hypothetical protein
MDGRMAEELKFDNSLGSKLDPDSTRARSNRAALGTLMAAV